MQIERTDLTNAPWMTKKQSLAAAWRNRAVWQRLDHENGRAADRKQSADCFNGFPGLISRLASAVCCVAVLSKSTVRIVGKTTLCLQVGRSAETGRRCRAISMQKMHLIRVYAEKARRKSFSYADFAAGYRSRRWKSPTCWYVPGGVDIIVKSTRLPR